MSALREIAAACRTARLRLGTAESCTGGLLGARITALPGASAFYAGGVICYSNALKEALLGVSPALLAQQGAVSPEVALAMARGALERLHVQVAVAVTGIAGPGGGTPAKPVGTVCLAVAADRHERVATLHLPGTRRQIREATCRAAWELLGEVLRERKGGMTVSAAEPRIRPAGLHPASLPHHPED